MSHPIIHTILHHLHHPRGVAPTDGSHQKIQGLRENRCGRRPRPRANEYTPLLSEKRGISVSMSFGNLGIEVGQNNDKRWGSVGVGASFPPGGSAGIEFPATAPADGWGATISVKTPFGSAGFDNRKRRHVAPGVNTKTGVDLSVHYTTSQPRPMIPKTDQLKKDIEAPRYRVRPFLRTPPIGGNLILR